MAIQPLVNHYIKRPISTAMLATIQFNIFCLPFFLHIKLKYTNWDVWGKSDKQNIQTQGKKVTGGVNCNYSSMVYCSYWKSEH
jgi:hypothetical protein